LRRLALLPPDVPTPWWSALLRGLIAMPDVEVLWVSAAEPADPRVLWLPFDPAAGRGRDRSAGADTGSADAAAAVVLDIRSPRAFDVAAIGHQVPVAVVVEPPLSVGPVSADRATAAALERLAEDSAAAAVICTDAGVARSVPAPLQSLVRIVPLGVQRIPVEPAVPAPAVGAPTVVLLGGAVDDAVRNAWSRVTARWPDAVLVTGVDELDLPSRWRALQHAQVALVLDSAGERLAEAMAGGGTVVAHGDAYAASIIEHARHGLLTDARSAELLASTLTYAIEYHEQLAPLRQAAREQVRTHLLADTLADRLLDAMGRAGGVDLRGRPTAVTTPVPVTAAG